MTLRVVGFVRVAGTDPQEFMLSLEDTNNTKPGYICTTETGTEPVIRETLLTGGMGKNQIDALFTQAIERRTEGALEASALVTHVSCRNPKCERYDRKYSVASAMVLGMNHNICPECNGPMKVAKQINVSGKGGGKRYSRR